MRIKSIEISNYRQYQKLNFSFPQNKQNDLHVIVAQNGVGKTNLLNAITWCLYGEEPHLGDDSKGRGLPILNLSAMKKAKSEGTEKINVEVTITAQDGTDSIIYRRILPVRVFPELFEYSDNFSVLLTGVTGNTKVYEGDEAKLMVEKYMPQKIREYFYFDGEQLNDYFISERRGQIREAIFSISQVDVVNRICKRIGELVSSKQKEAGAKAPDIKKINDLLGDCEESIDTISTQIKDIEEQIAISEKIIADNTEYLRGQDNLPELEADYQKLKQNLIDLEAEKTSLIESMFAFIRESKVAMAFYSAAVKTLNIISAKEADNALPPNIDKDLLTKMLAQHQCLICQQPLSQHEESIIQNLIESFQVSSATSNILMSIRNELERIINDVEQYPTKKKLFIDKKQKLDSQIADVEQALQSVDNAINKFSDKEEIRKRHKERIEHEQLRDSNQQKLGVSNQQLTTALLRKDQLKNDLSKALEKDAECDRIRQLISFAESGRSVMSSIEQEMMREVREKMEIRTTEYFMTLIWKKNTYDKIILNESFQLDLIHKDGYSCVGTCSAAERCLLALSFTLALHEVSGFNSLLFIDTPVARVSDTNRVNFANVLRDVSYGKQIIMTFSPDEYSSEIRRVFDPIASTNVELQMVDEKVTVVK